MRSARQGSDSVHGTLRRAPWRAGFAATMLALLAARDAIGARVEPVASDESPASVAVPLYPTLPPDARARAARLRAADPGLILLRAAAFDPLREGEPDFDDLLPVGPSLGPRVEREPGYRLLQLDGPLTSLARRELYGKGVEIVQALPRHALLVRLPERAPADALARVTGYRWSGPFLAGYKLAPELFDAVRAEATPSGTYELDVSLFPIGSADALAAAVARVFLDARIAFVKHGRPARVALAVPAAIVRPVVGSLLHDPAVEYVALEVPLTLHNDNAVWIGQSYDRLSGPLEALAPDPKPYGQSATIWKRGLTGAGQVIGIADTGLEYDTCFFEDPARAVVPQSVTPPGALTVDDEHRKILAVNGTLPGALGVNDTFRHGTHVSATVVGDDLAHPAGTLGAGHDHGDGMAPGARIVFEDVSGSVTNTCSTTIVVPSVQDLLQQEYDAGARIATNSWGGGNGTYDARAREIDTMVSQHEDLLVIFSAGNDGASGLANPSASKNCVSVGATQNYTEGPRDPENMAPFSSRGPAADGRLKPDVVAPGSFVDSNRFPTQYVSNAASPTCAAGDPDVCFPYFGGCYRADSAQACGVQPLQGTSMSSPVVAGLAALARQYFVEGFYPTGQADAASARVPSAALLKAILVNSARNMTGTLDVGGPPLAGAPSDVQGWGRVALDDALFFAGDSRRLLLVDLPRATGLVTGASLDLAFSVTAADQALEVTLVWTDPPASPVAAQALVNDLDLALTAPDGARYHGNRFTEDTPAVAGDRESLVDPPGTDSVNNVEGILVRVPQTGVYHVTVTGTDVPGDGSGATQGFALVLTGAVEPWTAPPPAPPPVPDGTFGTAMTATALDAAGSVLAIAWDATFCPAAGYRLLYGPLQQVGSYAIEGALCDLGDSGQALWSDVPGGDLWFLVAATDGQGVEGSFGRDSAGRPRAGDAPSGTCSATSRVNLSSCPQP